MSRKPTAIVTLFLLLILSCSSSTDPGGNTPPVNFTVSGQVLDDQGLALVGVDLTGTPAATASGADGAYSFTAAQGWDGMVTPVLVGYIFAPRSRDYADLQANQADQDYTGSVFQMNWVTPDSAGNLFTPPLTCEVAITGSAASIRFYLDGELLAVDAEAPFTAELNASLADAPGTHVLTATALDAEAIELASTSLNFFVPDLETFHAGTFGGPGEDMARGLAIFDDGRLLLAGHLDDEGLEQGMLLGFDESAGESWYRALGAGVVADLAPTDDGGCVLSGWTWRAPDRDGPNAWLLKLDSNGARQWSSVGGVGADWEYPLAVLPSTDGGYVSTGRRMVNMPSAESQLFLRKIDANGVQLWQHDYYSGETSIGHDLILNADGGFTICGVKNDMLWLLRTDVSGAEVWSEAYQDGGNFSSGYSLVDAGDGYVVAGVNDNALWLLKTDYDGDQVWARSHGGTADARGRAIIVADGGFIVTGLSRPAGDAQLYLLRTDGAGLLQWENNFGGAGDEEGLALAPRAAGGCFVAGWTNSAGAGGGDAWLLEIDDDGQRITN